LSFLLTATNASAYINHTLGHAKFTTHVGGGGQEARRIGRERGRRGRKGKHWEKENTYFCHLLTHQNSFKSELVEEDYVLTMLKLRKFYFICI